MQDEMEPIELIKDKRGFVDYMEAFDDKDLPDGAWQAKLEEGGIAYCEEVLKMPCVDGFDFWLYYCQLTSEQKQKG